MLLMRLASSPLQKKKQTAAVVVMCVSVCVLVEFLNKNIEQILSRIPLVAMVVAVVVVAAVAVVVMVMVVVVVVVVVAVEVVMGDSDRWW
jgi:hypothetical protein